MKNYFFGSWAIVFLLFLAAACDNYVAFVPPAQSPDTAPLLSNVPPPVDEVQSDNTEMDTINLPDSVILILPKLCVAVKGGNQPCNGVVDVHLRLLTSKKDIMLFGKPTTSATKLLETGGQAMLTILFNGDTTEMLNGQNFTLKIPVKRTLTDYRKMLFFTENSADIWSHQGALAASTREYYTISSNQLDTWLSPAYVHTPGYSNVRINLTRTGEGPDVAKARLFVVPTKVHSVVPATRINDTFVPNSALPLTKEATLVAFVKEGDTIWMGTQKVTLEPTLDVSMEFKSVTQQQVNEALSKL